MKRPEDTYFVNMRKGERKYLTRGVTQQWLLLLMACWGHQHCRVTCPERDAAARPVQSSDEDGDNENR